MGDPSPTPHRPVKDRTDPQSTVATTLAPSYVHRTVDGRTSRSLTGEPAARYPLPFHQRFCRAEIRMRGSDPPGRAPPAQDPSLHIHGSRGGYLWEEAAPASVVLNPGQRPGLHSARSIRDRCWTPEARAPAPPFQTWQTSRDRQQGHFTWRVDQRVCPAVRLPRLAGCPFQPSRRFRRRERCVGSCRRRGGRVRRRRRAAWADHLCW